MPIKLTAELAERLLSQPETGMGYQKVNIILKNGDVIRDTIVYNAGNLELPEKFSEVKVSSIAQIELVKEPVSTI
ncbi:MAG: hypothetical protein KJ967_02475 [Elusimicrobia bacterium]|nr:hypothetical protein [Elusimicrobiota bacterium]